MQKTAPQPTQSGNQEQTSAAVITDVSNYPTLAYLQSQQPLQSCFVIWHKVGRIWEGQREVSRAAE